MPNNRMREDLRHVLGALACNADAQMSSIESIRHRISGGTMLRYIISLEERIEDVLALTRRAVDELKQGGTT